MQRFLSRTILLSDPLKMQKALGLGEFPVRAFFIAEMQGEDVFITDRPTADLQVIKSFPYLIIKCVNINTEV